MKTMLTEKELDYLETLIPTLAKDAFKKTYVKKASDLQDTIGNKKGFTPLLLG